MTKRESHNFSATPLLSTEQNRRSKRESRHPTTTPLLPKTVHDKGGSRNYSATPYRQQNKNKCQREKAVT